MKRIGKLLFVFFLLYIPSVYADDLLCDNSGVLKALRIIYYIINILKILAPVFLITVGMKSLFQTILNNGNDLKEKVYILIEKFIIGGMIFLLPTTIYNIITSFTFTGSLSEYTTCNECLFKSDKCDDLINAALIKESEERQKAETAIQKLKDDYEKSLQEKENINSRSEDNTGNIAKYFGQKYTLTETQLKQIANQCYHEQGTPIGAAAEASLMANKFEMSSGKYSNIYDYVKNCGWWAHSKKNMSGDSNVSDSVVEAVRQVLIYGNRTLPYYIDEHDCFSDIDNAYNNGSGINVKNRSAYKQDVTVIYNSYGSVYTFYSFPTSTSDPFGYTASSYNKYNKARS